jgi:hypothetical protein
VLALVLVRVGEILRPDRGEGDGDAQVAVGEREQRAQHGVVLADRIRLQALVGQLSDPAADVGAVDRRDPPRPELPCDPIERRAVHDLGPGAERR